MENTKRARKEKSRIRPSGETYVKPKGLLSGLERVREASRRDSQGEWSRTVVGTSPMFWTCGRTNTAPISESTSLRHTPEVGAQCISSACHASGVMRGVPGDRHSYRDSLSK